MHTISSYVCVFTRNPWTTIYNDTVGYLFARLFI